MDERRETAEIGPFPWPRKGGPFGVTLRFEWIEGRWECVGVDVQATGDAVVTASILRSVPLASLIDKHHPSHITGITTEDLDGTVYTVESDRRWTERRGGGRPPKYGPEHYIEVAGVYREAYGNNRTPTRAVARHFKASQTQAAKWVAKCRELGLLPKTTRGRARVAQTQRKRTNRQTDRRKGGSK